MTNNTYSNSVDGEPPKTIHQTDDDGSPAKVTSEELSRFKDEVKYLSGENAREVAWRRQWADDIRFCRWEGQSPDGLKHADELNGEEPFPFEGARDSRVRSADSLVNEHVLVLTAAAFGASINVKPMESQDVGWSDRMNTLARYMLYTQLGADWVREIWRICQYQEGDSPAAAVMGVWWRKEEALRMETVTLEKIIEMAAMATKPPQDQLPIFVASMKALFLDPAQEAGAAEWLSSLYPDLKTAKAKKAVKGLRENNSASFPVRYVAVNRPEVCAYRLFQDIFVPLNTSQPRRARCYFLREWLSEVDLHARRVSHGYSEEFVKAVLGHEGKTGFPLFERGAVTGDGVSSLQFTQQSADLHKGEYEVITAVYRAVNDDGVPGIYTVPFSSFIEFAAKERELQDFAHGEYPFTWFSREVLTSRVVDSRGVPELEQTDQQLEKFIFDSFSDNASLAALPMIETPRSRGKLQLVIGPLKQQKVDRPGQIRYIEAPQYPAVVEKLLILLRGRRDDYWGRISANTPPALTQLHQQGRVNLFLASLKDAIKQLLQLCQQYLTDEELKRITGANNMAVARSRDEIQGMFDVDMSFSTIGLDFDQLVKVAEVISRYVLPIDSLNTVQRDLLVQWLLNAFNPNLADRVWRPSQSANADEQKDESINFARIVAGDEPPMQAEGQNFGLRLQTLQDIIGKNPEVQRKLTPVSKQMLEARMKHLQNQVQQQQNAVIGARVGESVLGG